jgi:16S rRNA (cytosine967-C5)-methyltransferase|tara:strand:+ start:666 stop:1985 length:1320 start_codon:yes stop_codon:yes gene_type:complete
MKNDARFLTVKVLNRFNRDQKKLHLIIDEIISSAQIDLLTRSRVRVLSNETIRFKGRLEFMIEYVSGRRCDKIDPSILSILKIAFYEILIDEVVPNYAAVDSAVTLTRNLLNRKAAGFTNAILRKLTRKNDEDKNWYHHLVDDPNWHSLPIWMQERWKKRFGTEQFLELVKNINLPSPSFIRVETEKIGIDAAKESLIGDGISLQKYSSSFLKLDHGLGKVLRTDLFRSGKISIQDPASAAIVDCMDAKPGETILDVCAAPGTKTLYLSNIVGETGTILASDLSTERVKSGKEDMKRHGQKNIQWSVKDAKKDTYPLADRILIDAPCTGTGVLGRRPDIRWICKPRDINQASDKQIGILNNCSKFLKPNGTLVYATCSIEPEENWNVVDRFLKLNSDFSVDTVPRKIPSNWIDERGALRTLTHLHGVDGMFAAKLKRKQ